MLYRYTFIFSPKSYYMKANIGLSQKNLASVKDNLGKILADAVVLYTKTRKFHLECFRQQFYGIT